MGQVSYGTITITDTNDIQSIVVEYAQNQSTSVPPPDTAWSTTRPAWAQDFYIWQRTRMHRAGTPDSSDVFGTPVCITGSAGQAVTIQSIRYAVSTTESQPTDSSFTYTSVPTVAEGSWLWTKTEYSDGSKIYTKSKQGVSGDSITVTKTEYQSGTSPTTAPSGTWSTTIPTVPEGNYLWTKTTYSDGNYSYTVAKQGVSGQPGTSVTIINTSVTYQVSSSGTTTPTGEWKSTVQSTTTGQYLWTRTIVTYSDGSSTTSYSVAAHGATGTSISISSIKYAKSTTDTQPQDSAFGTSIPTVDEGEWLWTMTTYSNGSKMYTKSKQGVSGEDGRSLTDTETKYTNVASGTTQSQVEALAESAWLANVPSYDASKPDYWVRVKNTYDKAPLVEYVYYKDNGTGESLYNSAMANSIAMSANENSQGALSQSTEALQTVTNIDNLLGGHFMYGDALSQSTPSGARVVEQIKEGTTDVSSIPSKWHHNVNIGANGIQLRYNEAVMAQLAANQSGNDTALKFYQPPTVSGNTTTQGALTMELSGNALKFYRPGTANKGMELTNTALKFYDTTGTAVQAEFGGTQATISGTINVYDGKIGNNANSYWYIGNYLDYRQNNSAAIKSHGTAFIQLGDSSTWRIATNRIHTAWNDDSSTGEAFRLHFPVYDSKYWDSGLHLPLSTTDKFLYMRNAPNTETLENLNDDLEDNGYNYWTYKFYVDGNGAAYAQNFYKWTNGSWAPIDSGTVSAAGRLTTGAGSLTQPVYFPSTGDNAGQPVATTYQLNAAGAKGVDTSMPATATNNNVPTTLLMKTFVEGKGYLTSETDPTVPSWAKASSKPSYALSELTNAQDVQAIEILSGNSGLLRKTAANTWSLDTNTYLTSYTETDPTVPSWAKASTKPSYALSELTNAQDVQAIELLSGTSGFLKKTAANTWTLDTNTYLTSYTETDPVFVASAAHGITSSDITNWNNKTSNVGTVTTVSTGAGLVGGDITSTGTIKANLTSETKLTNAALSVTEDANRIYPVRIDKNSKMVVVVPWTNVNSNYLTGITSNMVTTALGYTPYNSSNPSGYVTSSGVTKVTAGTGLKIGTAASGGDITTTGTINHINSVTAKTAAAQDAKTLTWNDTFTLYEEKYDAQGHITGVANYNMTMPSNPNTMASLYVGGSASTTNAQTTNGNTYLIVIDGTTTTRRKISGGGTVSVVSDSNGNITVSGTAHPTSLKNPNAITLNLFNETAARASTLINNPTSTVTYDGSVASQVFNAAGRDAITHIGIDGNTLSWVKADGSSGSSSVTITAEIASGTIKLTDSYGVGIDVGSSSTPVYFDDGVPVALTSTTKIDYNLLPTGTSASTVAIGNHTHSISLATDTGTTGVVNLSHGGKYKLTAGGNSVIFTLPSDNNTDTKVKLTSQSTSGTYPLMFGPTSISSGTAYEVYYNTGITVNPSTSTITATNFSGNASTATTATTASKLGSSSLGSETKPIYLSSGAATECSTYAGGTAVTLNGTSKAASTASFYAVTSAGTSGQVLVANASGIPSWTNQSSITGVDKKLEVAEVTTNTQYYPIVGTGTSAATRQYDTTGFKYKGITGTSTSVGSATLEFGNSTASGVAGNKRGQLIIYGTNSKKATITLAAPTADIAIALPVTGGTLALSGSTSSNTTGISIAAHGTTSVGSASNWNAGSASTWVFEDKTVATAASTQTEIPNVTSVGTASSWTFEEKTIPNVTNAGSASSWTFEEKTIPNVTNVGTTASLNFAIDGTDTEQLNITWTAGSTPTLGTAIKVQSKSGGGNGSAPTLGTAIKVQSKSGGSNGSTPTLGTAISITGVGGTTTVSSKKSGSNSTVPSLTITSTTVTNGTTHSVTDNGHTHTI